MDNSTFPGSDDVMDPLLFKVSDRPLSAGFLILASIIVLLMQLGFAQLEVGVAPAHSIQNIFMKNMLDTACTALGWYVFGFGLAYGEGDLANPFIGSGGFALSGIHSSFAWFVTFTYVNNASTIASGPLVGRTRLSAYMFMSLFMCVFAFPVGAHWVWARKGFLRDLFSARPLDFVGGGPVHLHGGMFGLVGSAIIGARLGIPKQMDPDRKYDDAYNKILAASGAYLLWISWLAFTTVTVGTLAPASQIDVIGRVATCTVLSGAAGAVVSFAVRKAMGRSYDIIQLGNSMMVGLVSITAGCCVVQPWAAIVIGAVGALLFQLGCRLIAKMHIDDPVDAAGVHITGGLWSVLATGLLADPNLVSLVDPLAGPDALGLFYGGSGGQLAMQLLEIVVIAGWSAATSAIFFYILRKVGKLRVSKETEMGGLDLFKHNGGLPPPEEGGLRGNGRDSNTTTDGQDMRLPVDTSNPLMTNGAGGNTMQRPSLTYLQSFFAKPRPATATRTSPAAYAEHVPGTTSTSGMKTGMLRNPRGAAAFDEASAVATGVNAAGLGTARARFGSLGAPDIEMPEISAEGRAAPRGRLLEESAGRSAPESRPNHQPSAHSSPALRFHDASRGPTFGDGPYSGDYYQDDSASDASIRVRGDPNEDFQGRSPAGYPGFLAPAMLPPPRWASPYAAMPEGSVHDWQGAQCPPGHMPFVPPWQDLYALQNIRLWQDFLDARYPRSPGVPGKGGPREAASGVPLPTSDPLGRENRENPTQGAMTASMSEPQTFVDPAGH